MPEAVTGAHHPFPCGIVEGGGKGSQANARNSLPAISHKPAAAAPRPTGAVTPGPSDQGPREFITVVQAPVEKQVHDSALGHSAAGAHRRLPGWSRNAGSQGLLWAEPGCHTHAGPGAATYPACGSTPQGPEGSRPADRSRHSRSCLFRSRKNPLIAGTSLRGRGAHVKHLFTVIK